MDRATLAQALSGGYIEAYDFDMHRNAFTMRVDVLDAGVLSSYDVRFEMVSLLTFETESRSDGERLEVTELWIDSAPEVSSSEEWLVTLSIFDMTHITLRCSAVVVDGQILR